MDDTLTIKLKNKDGFLTGDIHADVSRYKDVSMSIHQSVLTIVGPRASFERAVKNGHFNKDFSDAIQTVANFIDQHPKAKSGQTSVLDYRSMPYATLTLERGLS